MICSDAPSKLVGNATNVKVVEKSLSRSDGHVPETAASAVLFDLVRSSCSRETILSRKKVLMKIYA